MAKTRRRRSTDQHGRSFRPEVVDKVWAKVGGFYSDLAEDVCGANIRRQEYGQTTDCGWEIDHIHPVSLRGSDNLNNLQPLHWRNNRAKADRTDSKVLWCAVP